MQPAARASRTTWIVWLIALALVGALTFGAYRSGDSRTWLLALSTMQFTAATLAMALPLGMLIGWLCMRGSALAQILMALVIGLTLVIPLYLQAAAWQAGFGAQGWYTLQFGNNGAFWLDGWPGAIWISGLYASAPVAVLMAVGLHTAPHDLEEVALLDCTPWGVFWRITFPHLVPWLLVGVLWTAVQTGTDITVTDLFRIRTYAEEVFTELSLGGEVGNVSLGPASATLTIAWLLLVGWLLARNFVHLPNPWSRGRTTRGPLAPHLVMVTTALALLIMAICVAVPLGSLAYKAGVHVDQINGSLVRRWSALKTVELIGQSYLYFGRELRASLLTGALAATAACVFAAPLAWCARRAGVAAIPCAVIAVLCLAIPGPVLGVLLIHAFKDPNISWLNYLYDRTITPPVTAQAIRAFPLVVGVLWAKYRLIPRAAEEILRMEGAPRMTIFWELGIRASRRGIALAWLAALAVSLQELSATLLVVPPGMDMLSIRIFGLLHYNIEDQVAALSLAVVLLYLGAAGLVWGTSRWRGRKVATGR